MTCFYFDILQLSLNFNILQTLTYFLYIYIDSKTEFKSSIDAHESDKEINIGMMFYKKSIGVKYQI